MANSWLRLWHEMPTDPKWRTIARVSKQPVSLVQAVYLHLLVDASRNVTRGHANVTTEDLASALDVDDQDIEAILSAMQGRVMDGSHLTGWEKRQPKREDSGSSESGAMSAAERKRRQRQKQKEKESHGNVTQSHDESQDVTIDKDKDTDKDTEICNNSLSDNSGELPGQAEQDKTAAFLAKYPEAVGGCYTPSGSKWGSAQDRECAQWIYDRVLMVNSAAKEPNWPEWSNDVRLMRQQDKRNHREICDLFKWANTDSFWKDNILSPAKLRKQWDNLTAKRLNGGQQKPQQAKSTYTERKYDTDW